VKSLLQPLLEQLKVSPESTETTISLKSRSGYVVSFAFSRTLMIDIYFYRIRSLLVA
jgi:hypothetical protein